MERRQFITAAGAAVTVGLAGCLGDDDTDSPDSVVEAFLDSDDADQAEGYLHSESQMEVDDEDDDEEMEIERVETVEEENYDEEELEEMLPTEGDMLEDEAYDEDAIATFAEEENAQVEAEVTFEEEGEEFELEVTYLTSEEDGDWLIVDIVDADFSDLFGDL